MSRSVLSDKFFLPKARALPFPLSAKHLSSILQDQFFHFLQVLLKSLPPPQSSSSGDHPVTSTVTSSDKHFLFKLNRYICFALFDLSLGRWALQTLLVACFLAYPAAGLEFRMLEALYQ